MSKGTTTTSAERAAAAERRTENLQTADFDDPTPTTHPPVAGHAGNGTARVPARVDKAQAIAASTARGVKLARNAEHRHRFAELLAEAELAGFLQELLVRAGDHHENNELAPDDLKRQVARVAHAFAEGGERS